MQLTNGNVINGYFSTESFKFKFTYGKVTVGKKTIEVTEYNCERCGYKWIARHNGQNKGEPNFCPKCKTRYWNLERNKKDKGWKEIAQKQSVAELIRLNRRKQSNLI